MLCIGSATQDVFLLGGNAFKPKCESGVCYEHLLLGAKIEMDKVIFCTGGDAMNAATTFARQGLDTSFMGNIGTDHAGEAVLKVFDEEGINTRYLKQLPNHNTNYSTVLLAPNGERTILTYHGAPQHEDGSDLDFDAITHADWIYVSSVGSMNLLNRIFSTAAKNGVKIAFNPSTRELKQPDKLRALLDDVTVLITNKEEMQQIVEGTSLEELIHHAVRLVRNVVITDGNNGSIATNGVEVVRAGLYDTKKSVDRLGAGDAYGSGYITMLAQGKSIEQAVTFASANAHSVVQQYGAKAGILHKGTAVKEMHLQVTPL